MEPTLTKLQTIAAIASVPLLIFIIVNVFDQIRAPGVRFGPIKSTLYVSLIAAGTTASGVFVYDLANLQSTVTPLLVYSMVVSVLSTYLYAGRTLTVAVATFLEARRKAGKGKQS